MPEIPTETVHASASHQWRLFDLVGEFYDDPRARAGEAWSKRPNVRHLFSPRRSLVPNGR